MEKFGKEREKYCQKVCQRFFMIYTCMRFENLSANILNYYLSNKFERNKQMIRGIREYINADPMNKDWIKNNLNKQYNKQYIQTFLKLFNI